MENLYQYAQSWFARYNQRPTLGDITLLVENAYIAGKTGQKLGHELKLVRLGDLPWQREFSKKNGGNGFKVVSEYSATKTLGIREGFVWVSDGANVNLMPENTMVVVAPYSYPDEDENED
jgi:hypothetical protein